MRGEVVIKITIETDDPEDPRFQKVLEITGRADDVQLEDPKFPNHQVNTRWFMSVWKLGEPELDGVLTS